MLDIYHAGEHTHAAAAVLHGDPAAAAAWVESRRQTLLESGAAGLVVKMEAAGGTAPELAAYLAPHAGHTDYRRRLAEGRPIGRGMVKGE